MANNMPQIQLSVAADGTFGTIIEGKMRNAKINRDTGEVEWISFPKGPKHADLRETYADAAKILVGLLPRVP